MGRRGEKDTLRVPATVREGGMGAVMLMVGECVGVWDGEVVGREEGTWVSVEENPEGAMVPVTEPEEELEGVAQEAEGVEDLVGKGEEEEEGEAVPVTAPEAEKVREEEAVVVCVMVVVGVWVALEPPPPPPPPPGVPLTEALAHWEGEGDREGFVTVAGGVLEGVKEGAPLGVV